MKNHTHTKNHNCWWGCGEIGTPVHCWWECKMVQPLWKVVWQFLEKLNIELPYDPAIPLLSIYTEELNVGIWRGISTPICIAAFFTTAKRWQQPKRAQINEWINRMWSIHAMEYYSALKKNAILIYATAQMNLENMLSEISQTQKDKYCMMLLWGT